VTTPALMHIVPSRADFLRLSTQGNVVPVCTDLMADFETPVSAYAKLKEAGPAYLLESVEGGEHAFALQLHRLPPAEDFRLRARHHRDSRARPAGAAFPHPRIP
jgi:hypothetical protein